MPKIEKKKRIKLCILGILRTIDLLYAVGLSSWHMPLNNIVMKVAILFVYCTRNTVQLFINL